MPRPVNSKYTSTALNPNSSPTSPSSTASSRASSVFSPSSSAVSLILAMAAPAPAPALADVLKNRAPPPYTLGSFMAYLSANHCLETLEFSLDAEQYRLAYTRSLERSSSSSSPSSSPSSPSSPSSASAPAFSAKDAAHLLGLWQKLLRVYLMPYAPREINIPASAKAPLLAADFSRGPPPPTALLPAVRVVHELMTDSVLGPWIDSLADRGRPDGAAAAAAGVPSRSESSSAGSDRAEHMVTPPTTPPAGETRRRESQSSSGSSGWRKVGAKLGLASKKKKSPTSAGPEDVVLPSYY